MTVFRLKFASKTFGSWAGPGRLGELAGNDSLTPLREMLARLVALASILLMNAVCCVDVLGSKQDNAGS